MSVAQEKQTNVLESLPNEFTRREALSAAFKEGYSRSWLWEKIERGLITGALQRIERGKYRKTLDHTK